MHQYAVNWDQFHLLLLDLDIPTALRAKREAIVIDFDGRMGGLVDDRELGMEVEVLSR